MVLSLVPRGAPRGGPSLLLSAGHWKGSGVLAALPAPGWRSRRETESPPPPSTGAGGTEAASPQTRVNPGVPRRVLSACWVPRASPEPAAHQVSSSFPRRERPSSRKNLPGSSRSTRTVGIQWRGYGVPKGRGWDGRAAPRRPA